MKRALFAGFALGSAVHAANIDTGGFAQDGRTTYCQAATDEKRPLEFLSLTTASAGQCPIALELTTQVRSYSMAETTLEVTWTASVSRNASLFPGVVVAGVPSDVVSATLRACRVGSNCASDSDIVSPSTSSQDTALGAFDSAGSKKLASSTFTLASSGDFVLVGKITLGGESKPTDFVVFKHIPRSADLGAQPGTVQPGGGGSSSSDNSTSRPPPTPTTVLPTSTPTTASPTTTPSPHGNGSSSSSSPSPSTSSPSPSTTSSPSPPSPTSTSTPSPTSSSEHSETKRPHNSGSSTSEMPATKEPTRSPSPDEDIRPSTTPSPMNSSQSSSMSSSADSSSSSSPTSTPKATSSFTSSTQTPTSVATPTVQPQSGEDSVSSKSSSSSSHSGSTALITIAAVMAVVVASVFVVAARVRRARGKDDDSDSEEPTFRSSFGAAVPNLRELREQEVQTRVLRIVSSENPSPPSTFPAGSVAPSNLSYGSDKSNEDLSFSIQ